MGLRHFLTCEWKIFELQRWMRKQVSHMHKQKLIQSDQCTGNWTGAKWTILLPVAGYCLPDSTPGVDSVFGMHERPCCGLAMTAQHLAFLRHKLSLKNLCLMLSHECVFFWVVSSHESKHSWSIALLAHVIYDHELYHKMAKSTE